MKKIEKLEFTYPIETFTKCTRSGRFKIAVIIPAGENELTDDEVDDVFGALKQFGDSAESSLHQVKQLRQRQESN